MMMFMSYRSNDERGLTLAAKSLLQKLARRLQEVRVWERVAQVRERKSEREQLKEMIKVYERAQFMMTVYRIRVCVRLPWHSTLDPKVSLMPRVGDGPLTGVRVQDSRPQLRTAHARIMLSTPPRGRLVAVNWLVRRARILLCRDSSDVGALGGLARLLPGGGLAASLSLVLCSPASGAVLDEPSIHPGLGLGQAEPRVTFGAEAPNFMAKVKYDLGGQVVWLWRYEREDELRTFTPFSTAYDISSDITSTAVRIGCDDIFVSGVDDQNNDVITRLQFTPPAGRWQLRPTGGSAPPLAIGNSMPNLVLTASVVGGAFTQPPLRYSSPRRETVYRGTELRYIRSMAADPEGRFLLILTSKGELRKLDLLADPPALVPGAVYSIVDDPDMDHVSFVAIWQHATEGRKWVVGNRKQIVQAVGFAFTDSDNDGNHDSETKYDANDWVLYSGEDDWLSLSGKGP